MDRKIAGLVISFMFILPALSIPCSGDGTGFYYDPYFDNWSLLEEERQYALINYDDGFQKMIITIEVSEDDLRRADSVVWIFPIPSSPEEVTIDIMQGDEIPEVSGHDLQQDARNSVMEDFALIYSSQIVSIPLVLSTVYFLDYQFDPVYYLGPGGKSDANGPSDGVQVYQQVYAFGLMTELISATSSSAFFDYLDEHHLNILEYAEESIDEYIGSDYSFIISWISDPEEFYLDARSAYGSRDIDLSLGLSIGFPSEMIFFPLKMTSAYGYIDAEIPIQVIIFDHVEIANTRDFRQSTGMSVNYMAEESVEINEDMVPFFQEQILRETSWDGTYCDLEYTMVTIEAPAALLSEDFWAEDNVPAEIERYGFYEKYSWIITLPLFVLLSVLSSSASGLLTYRRQRPDMVRFAILGLANFLTFIGVAVISHRLKIHREFVGNPPKDEETTGLGKFLGIFIGIFLLSSLVCNLYLYYVIL